MSAGHHLPHFSRRDESVAAIFVKDPKGLPDFLLPVCGLPLVHILLLVHVLLLVRVLLLVHIRRLPGYHGEELWELNGAISVRVHLLDHLLKCRLCGVLPQQPHHAAQFHGADLPIVLLVKVEEIGNLLLSELVVDHFEVLITFSPRVGVDYCYVHMLVCLEERFREVVS